MDFGLGLDNYTWYIDKVIGGLQVPPVSCWTTPCPWSCCTPGHILAWMGIGDHSETVLLLALFDQSTPLFLKVMGWVCAVGHVVMCSRPCGGVGGPCDFSVSPSPFDLDFGTLGLWTLGLRTQA